MNLNMNALTRQLPLDNFYFRSTLRLTCLNIAGIVSVELLSNTDKPSSGTG